MGQEPDFRRELIAIIPNLRAFAASLAGSFDRADDLVQETLVKAWDKQHTFQPGTNLKAWLFTILRNEFYTQMRKKGREVQDVDGVHAMQLAGHPGATRPAHATAIGKMLLAAMPPDDLDRLLKALPMPAFTPRTITDARALRREIEETRRSGLAHDDCELDRDVRCVAVPVADFAGRCVAAMGISGPAWRMTPESVATLARQLRAAAAALTAELGGRPA